MITSTGSRLASPPRRLPVSLIALLICWPGTTFALGDYTVRAATAPDHHLELSLRLPSAAPGVERKLATRGSAWGMHDQVVAPHCGPAPLQAGDGGTWLLPASCERVTWRVAAPPRQDGHELPDHQSVSFPGPAQWTLLVEPTSLLRLVGDATDATLRAADAKTHLLGGTPTANGWRIPGGTHAPEVFIVGNAPTQEREAGGFQIRDVADNLDAVRQLGLLSLHEQALAHLVAVVFGGHPPPPADRSLLVVWLGIEARHRQISGVAGSRSFVANYLVGDREKARRNRALTLMVLAHEQFHQLLDVKRDTRASVPAWVNESLAHYFGLQAMQASMGKDKAAAALAREEIDPARPVLHKLMEFESLSKTDIDAARRLVYAQGATFWSEMDRALSAHPGGARTLASLIPGLLEMDFPPDDALPDVFVRQLREGAGPAADELLGRYAGNSTPALAQATPVATGNAAP